MKRFILFVSCMLGWLGLAQSSTVDLSFRTIAEMQAFPVTAYQTNLQAVVADVLRGGEFQYTPAVTATVNLGTVFAAGGAGGRWIRKIDGPLNVTWFGAVGNGVTDDTTAINSAAQAARLSYPQEKVWFPRITTGTASTQYRITSTLAFDQVHNIEMDGNTELLSEVSGAPAVDLGTNNYANINMRVSRAAQDWTADTIGFQIKQSETGTFKLQASNMEKGVYLYCTNINYIQYCKFDVGHPVGNKVAIYLNAAGSGGIWDNDWTGSIVSMYELAGVGTHATASVYFDCSGGGYIFQQIFRQMKFHCESNTEDGAMAANTALLAHFDNVGGAVSNIRFVDINTECNLLSLDVPWLRIDASSDTAIQCDVTYNTKAYGQTFVDRPEGRYVNDFISITQTEGAVPKPYLLSFGQMAPYIDGTDKLRLPDQVILYTNSLANDYGLSAQVQYVPITAATLTNTTAVGDGYCDIPVLTYVPGVWFYKDTNDSMFLVNESQRSWQVTCWDNAGNILSGTTPQYVTAANEQSDGNTYLIDSYWLWIHPDVHKVHIGHSDWIYLTRQHGPSVWKVTDSYTGYGPTVIPPTDVTLKSDTVISRSTFKPGTVVFDTHGGYWITDRQANTLITTANIGGDTLLHVVTTNGMEIGDIIGVELDYGTPNQWHWSTIATLPNNTNVTIVTGILGANTTTIGNRVRTGHAEYRGELIASATHTLASGATTNLWLDGVSLPITLSANTTWFFRADVVGRSTDAGTGDEESAGYTITGVVERDNTAANTRIVGAVAVTTHAEDDAAWDATATADTTNGGITITVTGNDETTIRWRATIYLTALIEVAITWGESFEFWLETVHESIVDHTEYWVENMVL